MGACDTCSSDFSCGRLAAALKVIGAMPDLAKHPRLERAFKGIKSALGAQAWDYADSCALCSLAGKDAAIHEHTAALIDELRRDRVIWARCDPETTFDGEDRHLD